MTLEIATFGGGCFWGVETAFRQLPTVSTTTAGYMGGTLVNPTYEDVCSGNTGHAEVVQVQYDPTRISYDELLEVFWDSHNPTELNRQGPDIGVQYRSVIFYHNPTQQAQAEASRDALANSGKYTHPIVTEVLPAQTFLRPKTIISNI